MISVSVGPSFSNFINSEAPHKINIYGSDIYPAIIDSDVTNSIGYYDYETNLLKDIKLGLSIGLGFEYYLKNDISIYFSLLYEEKGIDLSYNEHESSIYEFVPNPPNSIQIPAPQTNIAYIMMRIMT